MRREEERMEEKTRDETGRDETGREGKEREGISATVTIRLLLHMILIRMIDWLA